MTTRGDGETFVPDGGDTWGEDAATTAPGDATGDATPPRLDHLGDEPEGRYSAPPEGRSLLGRGGLGEVVRVHDAQLGRDVALKQMRGLPSGPDGLRFLREARITAQLDHPGIAFQAWLQANPDHGVEK